MNQSSLSPMPGSLNPASLGPQLYDMIRDLYPICRSITGNGVRRSLELLQRWVPLRIHEVPTGTQVFDWVVPREWNIHDAYIMNRAGQRVVDFKISNLHVLNYSIPVRCKLPLSELRKHLFTLPDQPDWIPYRTSYYRENWGFCLAHRQLDSLPDDDYEVFIDSELEPGHLTYGELVVPGAIEDEILISCHCCHPSLCNDNLSGMVMAAKAAQLLAARDRRYTYRFLWAPGTIGAITWLALHPVERERIKHGLVLSCLGDSGRFTYKRSRQGKAEIDRIVECLLRSSATPFEVLDFTPNGYDERQYCSPGINLPVGCFMRTPNGRYPEYHTSADNLDLISAEALDASLAMLLNVFRTLDANRVFRNLNPCCEPQLGRRGLYRPTGGSSGGRFEEALLWVLNFSDSKHSLLDIAERSTLSFDLVSEAAQALIAAGLIEAVS